MLDQKVGTEAHERPAPKVLLVDDDETNRFVTVAKLRKRGYCVESAENGIEAYQRLESEAFNVVLMDVSMPIMDGFEATQRIRTLSVPQSSVPIIGLTAHGHEEVRNRCMDVGMDDFLCKPVRGDVLCATVEKWVGR